MVYFMEPSMARPAMLPVMRTLFIHRKQQFDEGASV